MADLNLFYTVLAICAVIITGTLLFVGIELIKTLKQAQVIMDDIEETTNDFNTIKNGVKAGVLSLASAAIDKFQKELEPKGGGKIK